MFDSNCQYYINDNKKCVLDENTGELIEILQDFSQSGRENPHSYNKRMTNYLSDVYRYMLDDLSKKDVQKLLNGRDFIDISRIPQKLSYCSNYIEFAHLKNNEKHISYIESCHSSLCPTCNFFRSRNNLRDMILILEDFFSVDSNCDYPFLFLTLTVPDCPGSDLKKILDKMSRAFHKFLGYKEFERAFIGCSRSLEITVCNDEDSKSFGLFHPHFHVLLIADKEYFSRYRDLYLDKLHILYLWQRAMGVHKFRKFSSWFDWFETFWVDGIFSRLLGDVPPDLITCVDIKRAKFNKNQSQKNALKCISLLGEVIKYNFKPDNILTGDIPVDSERVFWLDGALYHRRRWNLDGVLKEIQRKLSIPEDEQLDLISVAGIPLDEIDFFSAWWFSPKFGEYLKGKIKSVENKNSVRRLLGLPLIEK